MIEKSIKNREKELARDYDIDYYRYAVQNDQKLGFVVLQEYDYDTTGFEPNFDMKKVAIMKIKKVNHDLINTNRDYDREIIGELDYQIHTIGNEKFIKIVSFSSKNNDNETLKLLFKFTENRARIYDSDSIEIRGYTENVPQFLPKLNYKKLADEGHHINLWIKTNLEKHNFNSNLTEIHNNFAENEKI